jgi:hypothetical protein
MGNRGAGGRRISPERAANRDKFWALVARFNQLGCLLPDEKDLDPDDVEAVTEARLVIDEMNATRRAMDELLDAEKARRLSSGEPWP